MKVAIMATMPPDTYSGGRYYAFMLAEALAAGGHETHFITNNRPIFLGDLSAFPDHDAIHLTYTDDYCSNLPEGNFDAILLVPGTSLSGFYDLVELFAMERNAHLVLINFESGNWFNALSPVKRPLSNWAPWKKAATNASLILSISKEGDRWAKEFYTDCWPQTTFDYCYPPLNTPAAEKSLDVEREKRILVFMRFSMSAHKGANHLEEIFCDAMAGYTLVFILGKEEIPALMLENLIELAQRYRVRLELMRKLSDEEKFREYRRATLLLFPSFFEGFGYPPVEAQYCGTDCVAFDLPVLRETCGDGILYAERGDWDGFRNQIAVALKPDRTTSKVENEVASIALLSTTTKQLENLLGSLPESDLPSRASRARKLRLQHTFHLNDFMLRVRMKKIAIRDRVLRIAGRVFRRVLRIRRKSHRVTYFPAFDDTDLLSDHYHRACWYLPFVEGSCESVSLYQTVGGTINPRPDYMAPPPLTPTHIDVHKGRIRNLISLFRSDVVLLWRNGDTSSFLKFLVRFCGIKVVNVATEDLASKEYGTYASIIWLHLQSGEQQERVLELHKRKFGQLAKQIRSVEYKKASVFGTGPSLTKAYDFDFSDSLNIVCNSIVQNEALLDHLNPRFISAGDVVSHLGVSAYAHQFRNDLIHALKTRELTFVTTASFGALFLYHYPELEDKVILIPQTCDGPVFDLQEYFGAPRLDSTLNIHMLPLAATFCDTIWILGCDGKSEEGDNEDFWTHAKEAQYHDLVDSGLRCHPTFDIHRQLSTYDKFLKSTQWTVEEGEKNHGKQYLCLAPSSIPSLRDRQIKS